MNTTNQTAMNQISLTIEQRNAIEKLYNRLQSPAMTLAEYIESAQTTIGCDGAIVVKFASMYVCIEKDGYAHS